MLPDIDSGPGRPLRESLAFAAAVISTMLVDRFQQFQWSMDSIILAAAGAYLFVRFGMAEVLQRFTVHRGMFHSLPAAAIFGEIAFLLCSGTTEERLFKAGAVVVGYLSHLILDEIYSVEYVRGMMTFKRSFGTALKIYGHGFLPNLATYGALAAITYLSMQEPTWMQQHREQLAQQTSEWTKNGQRWAQDVSQRPVDSQSRSTGANADGPARLATSSMATSERNATSPAAVSSDRRQSTGATRSDNWNRIEDLNVPSRTGQPSNDASAPNATRNRNDRLQSSRNASSNAWQR
jgi:membrane-bound metal-dependent hydrolase YbcI (DUF457 family)